MVNFCSKDDLNLIRRFQGKCIGVKVSVFFAKCSEVKVKVNKYKKYFYFVTIQHCVVVCCVVLCCVVLYCVVLCCVVLYCVVLCCAVLCCVVLYCVVLCCVVLCCVVW